MQWFTGESTNELYAIRVTTLINYWQLRAFRSHKQLNKSYYKFTPYIATTAHNNYLCGEYTAFAMLHNSNLHNILQHTSAHTSKLMHFKVNIKARSATTLYILHYICLTANNELFIIIFLIKQYKRAWSMPAATVIIILLYYYSTFNWW